MPRENRCLERIDAYRENRCQERIDAKRESSREEESAFFVPGAVFGEIGV